MKPMQSYLAVCLAVVTFCAVTCEALVSETVNDTLALAHCVHLIEPVPLDYIPPPYTFQKGEYRNHNCSLVCDYLESVQSVPFCGGRGGGCHGGEYYNKSRVGTFNLNEGQPCASESICHNGHCIDADSNHGNLTAKLNSISLNDQINTKDPFAKCNTSAVDAGYSAIVLCIDSQRRNVSTLTEMSGFMLNYPFGPFEKHEHGTSPAEMCDLLYCFEWIPTLTNRKSNEPPPKFYCHYGNQFLSTSDNINFLYASGLNYYTDTNDCILDVIQLPLSELVQDHGKRSERVLQFAHIDVPLNVTLEWTKVIL